MSVRFAPPARRAIERAMIVAETARHTTLDTGHLLLGLLTEPAEVVRDALAALQAPIENLREATFRMLAAENTGEPLTMEISRAADDALLRGYQRSVERGSPLVEEIDILHGLAADAATTSGVVLGDAGVTPDAIARLAGPVVTDPQHSSSVVLGGVRRTSGEHGSADDATSTRTSGGAAALDSLFGGPAASQLAPPAPQRRASAPHNVIFGGTPARMGPSRSGIGYDSHRFAPGGPLVLGGVRIEGDVHLAGHSDGDAIAHAVTDAVLGAAGAGDIGEMFSDRDPANAGRDSIGMLRLAVERVRARGWSVQQVDVTVVTEQPKIALHRAAMREALAGALGVATSDVSVKGKTNEGMGSIGRGEGLACMAVATLVAGGDDDYGA